ncbi:MAG: BON domain-containing protein [Planctomycetes bacterium]|nr:BON domain-containing protein [Planctomycetota bacterium]
MMIAKAEAMAGLVTLVLLGSGPAVRAEDPPSDSTVGTWVYEAIQQDPRVSSAALKVTALDGIVTISGSVPDLLAKRFAVEEAKKIEGVRGVVDEIVVEAVSRSGADIRQDIRRRLVDSALIHSRDIWITVVDGVATLHGSVESWTERDHARQIASEVRGVRDVKDELRLHWLTKRPDTEIRDEVQAMLRNDVYLSGRPIQVGVREGIVRLTGEVASAYEKDRAGIDAMIENVERVVNDLVVTPRRQDGTRREPVALTDEGVKEDVELELSQDWRLEDPFEITVQASSGHVTLRGTVPTVQQRHVAYEDAGDVLGVVWITNLLRVNPEIRGDDAIEQDVRIELHADYALSALGLGVRVEDGIVTLTGTAKTDAQKRHAVDVASWVTGVRDVIDQILLAGQKEIPDSVLRERIRSRLDADSATHREQDRITVEVADGKATLGGTVESWATRREADHVARFTEGVRSVTDRIRIAGTDYPWETY